jgi:hypothetical protein
MFFLRARHPSVGKSVVGHRRRNSTANNGDPLVVEKNVFFSPIHELAAMAEIE